MAMQKSSSFEGLSDEQLVRLSQAGRRDAFSELTRRNYSVSLKLAISILHDREEAEDEVQNAYWKAWQHIDQFHDRREVFHLDDADCGEPVPDAAAQGAAGEVPLHRRCADRRRAGHAGTAGSGEIAGVVAGGEGIGRRC